MAEKKDPFADFGGSIIANDKDPFAEFGGSKLRGKPLDTDLPIGSEPLPIGSKPFLPQVSTKIPSVLLSDAQKQQREQERIGKRFETTLLNIPTEFGRVAPAMKAAKQIQETLPEAPSFRKYGEIPRMQPTAMTEGQLLGESLTKGTDFQELTTDKFTGKKTGLQKQIENAENAFRAYQGDEIANQVQSYIPPEETIKIKQELGFGEKMSNAGSNFVNKLERFVPNTALAVGQTLTTLLGEDLGSDAYRMVTAGGNADIHRMEAFDKLAKLDAEYKYSKGLIQSVQDLDLGGVAAAVTDAVGSLVSSVVTSAPTAGLGLYSDMVGGGLYDYNSTKANRLGISTNELYESGQNEFFVPAIINGIGAKLESIGLKGIKEGIISNITSKAGQKAGLIFHNSNKEGFTEWTQSGLESYSNSLAQGKNFIQAGEDAVKTMFSKKGAESYLMGSVAAGAAIGGGRILKGIYSSKERKKAAEAIQRIEQQQQELSNPDISEESRVFIFENIKNNIKEVVNAVYADVDESDNLSGNQKKEVSELNKTVQALEVVINDPAVSEETKASAQTKIDELKSKIDGIIAAPEVKIAKPTFDTEEQLIEEGKTAEEEYKKTGDQVTYEQKIKELEEREKNLVPAPEDAEIGKPEEVVEVEPIRQLGTGANVYFETEKYRVNDELKNGKFLLNIQSQTSEIPIANVEFDNANDAVIIAQELNNKFPDGVPDAILIDKYIEQLKNDLLKPQEYAVQVETAGQVPVLTEAPVGEEVEQGKPQPKTEVIAEEGGKAEEVNGKEFQKIEYTKDNILNKFLNTLNNIKPLQVNPINTREFIYDNKSALEFSRFDKGDRNEVSLQDISVFNKGEGIGNSVMKDITDSADNLGITLTLDAKPFGNDPKSLDVENLVKFYQKNGFEVDLNQYEGDFGSAEEIIDYVKEYPSESIPMYRKPAPLQNKVLENKVKKVSQAEQTPAQQVEQLRADEQAELKAAIPNADQYLTDGKVDRAKITDAKDLKKFDEIYNKYDKLITPLLPKKETKAEQSPEKTKATKLKSKVDTRLKFQEVSDLSTKINEAVKGSAKRKRLINDRNLLLEKFPVIKYVYDNIQNVTKQLIQKGTITKDKDKVTYNGVNYSSDEFSSLLHDGLLDQLVKDKIIDDSDFVKKAEVVEKTEFDTEEEAELYDISKETDPNVIAAKFNDLPTSEETNFLESQINDFLGSKGKINERDWREYDDINNLTPEIRKRYIDSTNKSEGLDGQSEELADNLGMKVEPSDFINFVLDYGSQKGFKEKQKSNIQQALEERYFDLTGKNITPKVAEKSSTIIREKNKTTQKLSEQKEALQEAGITEEDIAREQEFAKEGFGELETPLEKFEYQKKQISKKGKTELEINKEIFAKAKEMADAIRGAKIDGKGMKGFYGSPSEGSKGIIGGVAEKLFGQKVRTVEIQNKKGKIRKASWGDGEVYELVDENGNVIGNYGDKDAAMKAVSISTQYSIDITPELKQAVKEGIPLFKNELTQAKEKLKEASVALSKLNKNLGIYSDPEQNARALFEYHKALVGVAKAYIKEIVKSGLANIKLDIKEFAESIGESVTQEIRDAWKEAKGISKKTLSDFKAEIDTSLINEEVKLKRDIYGFDEPLLRETKPNPELLEEAIQNIKDGESVYDIIDKVNNGEPLTDVETVMLAQFQGTKEAELYKINKKIEQSKDSSPLEFDKSVQKRAEIIDDLIASYNASELSGTVTGRALQARKVRVLQDYSLANMLIRVRKANNNRNLTNEQINEVTDRYNELIEAEAKLKAKVEQLTKDNENLKLAKSEARLRKEAVSDIKNRNRAEVKEALKKERSSIIEEMKKILNKNRNQLSMNPIPVEMLPLVGKLAKNYFLDGVTSIETIVDNVYEDVKGLIDGVTKRDVRDAISGYGRDTRPTQDELQRELYDLREQAKLISRIEDTEAGVKKAKDERVKRVASDEVLKLRARLKDLTKGEDSLEAIKKSLKRRIAETKNKIDKKDYSKPEKIEVELDDEAKKLQDAYRKIKFEFDVAVEKDKLANRTQAEVWQDRALAVLNLPRALMATADLSAPLRQGLLPTLSNPVMASKAFAEMLRQWNSKDVADTWLADLKDSPGYQLMQLSGLYIADRTNAKVTAREEEFQTNLAERIPVAGLLVAKSERAYAAYLNKMRADLFMKGVNVLQNDGVSFASNPKAYKALATYINASTGRGDLGMIEKAAPILNAAFFSPRLMASRIQLLTNWANPSFYKNTPAAVRKMYFKDMGTFIAFGMGILALASLSGADTEEDPRSPDFGKIRSGNTRWDIWGTFQQFIRYASQIVTGEKKSTASGKITPLDGSSYSKETRMSVIGNFVRSKLAPVPSAIVDYLYGENMIGDPFNLSNTIISRVTPLVWQGVYESAKQDGWINALIATGVPSVLGVGVQTYGLNDFLEQGVDDKSIKLLIDKKAVAIEPKETERTVIDAVTGEKRKMDDDEFEKYYASWADYIKKDLKENYSEYQKMSPAKFEDEFRKIKSNATSYAKEQVTSVIPETLTLEIDNVTYKLTPDKVAERKEYIQEYIDENEDKRFFERKVEKLIEKGSIKDSESAIKKFLMSEAKRYATEKMKKDYEDNPEELGVVKD